MKAYKLMTHTDLDGVACAVLAKLYLKEVDIDFCTNNNIIGKLDNFLERYIDEYEHLIITDLPINEELAEKINRNYKSKVNLIDHHETEKAIGNYEWAEIKVSTGEHLHCGTELFYKYLLKLENQKGTAIHDEFVELVRLYDTWDWEKRGNLDAARLNDLLGFQSIYRFVDEMEKKLKSDYIFTEEDKQIIEILQENKQQYIKRKVKQMIAIQVKEYKVGVVFGEQYISELGNELADQNSELDLIAIFTGKRVSLRSNKKNINLGEWSKLHYGGGGHALSAGMSINDDRLLEIANLLFKG